MPFTCRQCGSCCMHMGDYITIEEMTGPFEFLCISVSTGAPFFATVDPDKRDQFSDRSWIDDHPTACPFLRPTEEQFICTIHRDSPPQCRDFRCVVMRILTPESRVAGIVTGTLALHTEDQELRGVWEECERGIPSTSQDAENRIAWRLKEKGYRIL